MNSTDAIIYNLARAFLSSDWSIRTLRQQGRAALGRRPRWLSPLISHVLASFPTPPATVDTLVALLRSNDKFVVACQRHLYRGEELRASIFWVADRMNPASGLPSNWKVPALTTHRELADWLGLTVTQLDWYADIQGREAQTPSGPLRHYLYRWLPVRKGKRRLLEQPKPRLKTIQRQILGSLLCHIPCHDAAHGYRKKRSAVSYAAPHVQRDVVLRMDLQSFFPSVQAARVRRLFVTAGYPDSVAATLTGLCTNVVPADILDEASTLFGDRQRLVTRHLPQGAPTSPALANLCAYRVDRRLSGLARISGATYTRYADDLAFSGDESWRKSLQRFHVTACKILLEEGFAINTRKTRVMPRGGRQSLAGVVVNERTNCRRADFDRLKAILTNCLRHGPQSQNRLAVVDFRAHLLGRVGHLSALNPARGKKLRTLFDRINWHDDIRSPIPQETPDQDPPTSSVG